MKHLTRILLLCGILIAFLCVTVTYATHSDMDIAYPVTGGNIYFNKATGAITGCDTNVTEALIPETIGGISVAKIGNIAFFGCYNLISVDIPIGVYSIGDNAFSYCRALKNLVIPDTVTSMGTYIFQGCTNLESVKLSNGIESLAEGTFYDCECLKSIEIPNSVTIIENDVFVGCKNLKNAKIPDGVTFIRDGIFAGCSSLESIEISKNVTGIAAGAFHGCSSLTSINVESENENYISLNGVLFSKNQTRLILYPEGKIEQFYSIPSGVTFILTSAFYRCVHLKNLEIPDSVTHISESAFAGCSALLNIKIPKSVISVDSRAFSNCSSLKSVEIPESLTTIKYETFLNCESLRDIYYTGSKEQWEQIWNQGLQSDNITIHYNASMPDTPNMPEFVIPSAPTVNGHAIGKADLGGLTEISVPLSVSADTPTQITLCAPFYDGNGKFVGMGIVTQTVDKNTTSIAVPVAGDVSGSEKLSVVILGADLRPLSVNGYPIS